MSIQTLIADAVEYMEKGYDFTLLIEACKRERDIKRHRNELWALHHCARKVLNEPIQVDGVITSESVITFLLATLSEEVIDDPRRIDDFPLIKFHPKWSHPMDKDVPISRLSQHVVVDAMFALDWFLLCDQCNDEHSPEMIQQAREMFSLIKNRICFLIHAHHLSKDILNAEDYAEVEKKGLFSKPDTAVFDYDSDDEMYNRRPKDVEDLTHKDVEVAFANTAFVFDMEAYITFFHEQLFAYDTTSVQEVAQHRLSRFRGALFDAVSTVDEKYLIKERLRWQLELEIHDAHIQVHRHHHGLTLNPKPRQILVTKNDGLVTFIKSFKDITTRDVEFTRQRIRLSTDAMFWAWSMQGDKVVSKIKDVYIWRDRVRGHWVVKLGNRLLKAKSFAHGFFLLRNEHEEIDGLDLRGYDSML